MEEKTTIAPYKITEKCSFSCHFCNYSSDKKTNLRRHETTMHEITHRQLFCCGQSFLSKASYRDHSKQIHKDGHKCQICYRVFNRKALLKRHQSVHTGKREFQCLLCSYASSHKSNLDRHMKTHPQVKEETEAKETSSTSSQFEHKFPILSALLSTEEERKRRISHSIDAILSRPVRRDSCRLSESPEEWILRDPAPLSFLRACSFESPLPPTSSHRLSFPHWPYVDPFFKLNLN